MYREGAAASGTIGPVSATGESPRWGRESGLVALIAGLCAVPVLQMWRAPLSVPIEYDGDATFYLMVARELKQSGSYLTTSHMGFPYGQQLYDLPQGVDNLNLLVLRMITWFCSPATAVNLFFLLGFALAAATSHYVLRRLGARAWLAGVGSLLYAFVPYHLLRNSSHLLLSSYALVPLAVLFVLTVMGDDAPFVGQRQRWWPGWRLDRQAGWVLAGCIGLGSTGSYYGVFFGYLAVAAGLIATIARRHLRHLWSGLIAASITLTVMLLNTSPTILYWARHGSNPKVFARLAQETEQYGLRIQQLFMPRLDHRVGRLARIGYRAFAGPIYSEQGAYLGAIIGLGFVVTVVAGLAATIGGASPRGRLTTISHAGLLGVIAMLTATTSGVSYLLALGGLTMIRGWNRMSIVIAFLGVIGLAVGLSVVADRLRFTRGPRFEQAFVAMAVVVALGVGWFDQTSPSDARSADVETTWNSDAEFFTSIRSALPSGSAVYQFPESPFPEGGSIGRTGLYDGARAYVLAPELRWSFGAVLGRFPERPADLPTWNGARIVEFLHGQGFRAVVIDRLGYDDQGVAMIDRFWSQNNPPVAQSADGRYVWFDIGPPA